MRKKLRGNCPCGYAFTIIGEMEEAISLIQSHFDLFHKDFLPFGITIYEASTLVEKNFAHKKTDALKRALDSSRTRADSIHRKGSVSTGRKERGIFSTPET